MPTSLANCTSLFLIGEGEVEVRLRASIVIVSGWPYSVLAVLISRPTWLNGFDFGTGITKIAPNTNPRAGTHISGDVCVRPSVSRRDVHQGAALSIVQNVDERARRQTHRPATKRCAWWLSGSVGSGPIDANGKTGIDRMVTRHGTYGSGGTVMSTKARRSGSK